MEQSLPSINQR